MTDAAFRRLRETPLHTLTAADWPAHYAAMAPWLVADDPRVRDEAVERLAMAVFRAEPNYESDPETRRRTCDRAVWLFAEIEAARARHADVLPRFLLALRWHADDDRTRRPLIDWLEGLRPRVLDEPLRDMIDGTIVLADGVDPGDPSGLDHRSTYVRGCVAYAIGSSCMGDAEAFDAAFLADLTAREIARPGIAGPFWSGWGPATKDLAFDPLAWMLDIIERRAAPEPPGLPFNGIDFHVHELADHSPDGVRRLLAAGREDLAVMAAIEIGGVVAGMAAVLHDLGASSDAVVAAAAHQHLARFYGIVHPAADPERIRLRRQFRPGVDLAVIRQGTAEAWHDVAVVTASVGASVLDDARAWAILDEILPAALRGDPAEHWLAATGAGPGPVRIGGDEHLAFASGAAIELRGDPETRCWQRIEILGRGLQNRWRPLDLAG